VPFASAQRPEELADVPKQQVRGIVRTYPVLEHGHPIGLLAFRSVATVPRDEWNARRVRDAMIPFDQVPLLGEGDEAIDALAALSASAVNRGLVVDDGRLAGFLSITDLAGSRGGAVFATCSRRHA
jgi:predicted transcriptional regulator